MRSKLFIFLSITALLLPRWLNAQYGLAAEGGDFGGHLRMAEILRQRGPWPLEYFGIWGSHFFSILLGAFGIGLSKAMLILSDLSFLLSAFALFQIFDERPLSSAKWLVLLSFVTFGLGIYLDLVKKGFLTQLLSWAPYSWALYYASKKNIRKMLPLSFLGAWCYPDFVIGLLPVLVMNLGLPLPRKWLAAVAFVPSAVLIFFQMSMATYPGWTGFPLDSALFFGAISIFLIVMSFEREDWVWNSLFIYFVWSFLFWIGARLYTGNAFYYSRKNFYFMGIAVPILIGKLWIKGRYGRVLALSALLLPWGLVQISSQSFTELAARLLRPVTHYTSNDEFCARNVRKIMSSLQCRKAMALTDFKVLRAGEDPAGRLSIRSMALNSALGQYGDAIHDVSDGTQKLSLPEIARQVRNNMQAPNEDDGAYVARFLNATGDLPGVDCWLFKERVFRRDGTAIFECSTRER